MLAILAKRNKYRPTLRFETVCLITISLVLKGYIIFMWQLNALIKIKNYNHSFDLTIIH